MALALSGCFRSTQQYMVYDPNTGQSYMTTSPPVQQAYGYPQQQGFELYGQGGSPNVVMAGHSPSKTGVNALTSRPSRSWIALCPPKRDARHKAGHDSFCF